MVIAPGAARAQTPSTWSPVPAAVSDAPALPGPRPTEAELARGLPIARIAYAGHRRTAEDDLDSYFGETRVGRPFSPEGLGRDVRELWASGLFEDIEIDLAVEPDGVALRVLVRERAAIKAVEIAGNHEIGEDDLREAASVELTVGSTSSHGAVERAAQKLRDKYAEQGFALAEVSSAIVPQKGNEVVIRFTIVEHEKLRVRRITFVGNAGLRDDELRAVMITGQSGLFDFGSGAPFRSDALERDVLALSALYYDKGYLGVQIETPRIMVTPDREGVELSLSIHEGPRYRIRSLRVLEQDADGREVEPLGGRRHLREMVRAKIGDWFNRAELVHDLQAVQTMYRDAGYAHAQAEPASDLDPDRAEVDLSVVVRRRELVRIGRIEIRGNTKTADKVIRREMELAEGDLFSETKLERSRRRIAALGFFERADVSVEEGDDASRLELHVEVSEKPTGTFQLGAGFSSAESFMLNAQIQQHNLLGTGRSLSLQAQISGVRQLVDLHYFDPYLLDSKLSLGVDLHNQLRTYDQFSQTSKGGSITLGYPLDEPHLRASLTYTLQSDQVAKGGSSTRFGTSSSTSVFQRLPLSNLFDDGVTSSIRPTLTYDTRNNHLGASSGMFLQGSVEIASSLLGTQNEYVRYRGTGRFYYPVTHDGSVVLKLNAEAGLVTSPSDEGVPIFARFFLGGIADVRGFPLRSVGPRLPLLQTLDPNARAVPEGANIGGNLMYYQNLELEFPILKQVGIRGVVFTDLGNTWNLEPRYCRAAPASKHEVTDPCFSFGDLLDLRASWGFGIRWSSPLGPLRFEWGFPFERLPYERPSLFEFSIGGSF